MLVEELELDLGVAGEQTQRRLERRAERAAGRGEDRDRQRRLPLEALDQPDAAAELRALVVERERGLRGDREPELADLTSQREQRDRQRSDADERDGQADAQPSLGRERSVGQERQHRERGGEAGRAHGGTPADSRPVAEAPARLPGAPARDRDHEQQREEPEQNSRRLRGAGHSGSDRHADHAFERDRPRPGRCRAAPVQPVARERPSTALAGGELGRCGAQQDRSEDKAEKTHDRQAAPEDIGSPGFRSPIAG